jgi:hypothetical protein
MCIMLIIFLINSSLIYHRERCFHFDIHCDFFVYRNQAANVVRLVVKLLKILIIIFSLKKSSFVFISK